jgi:Fe-S-cluster-containing dehydrogenase component
MNTRDNTTDKAGSPKSSDRSKADVEIQQWYMIIDVALCEDCNNCFLACKDEHVDNEFPGFSSSQPLHGHRWMNIFRKERGQFPMIDVAYRPTPCMHCENAPCIRAAKDGSIYKREDGIVIIDPVKAKGRKDLESSCPYGAIFWNEEKSLPQKCTFCAHLLTEGWTKPRCVQACPTGALKVVHTGRQDMAAMVDSETLLTLHPEFKTLPHVYFKNLYRFDHCFVAGSVSADINGVTECAEDAVVKLLDQAGSTIGETVTDNYGDFKFDHLKENSGVHVLEISKSGYETKRLDIEVKESVNAGTIHLN